MALKSLVEKTRSVRRFQADKPLPVALLRDLVDLARLGGSARNRQPWKYLIIDDQKGKDRIFPELGWAGYLRSWPGPEIGERPSAYILCLLDQTIGNENERELYIDLGIATQNLLLGAAEHNVFGCRIGSFSPNLAELLAVDDRYKLSLVIALGYPAEKIVLEEVGEKGDIRYWRDEQQTHHVPKRPLSEILLTGLEK